MRFIINTAKELGFVFLKIKKILKFLTIGWKKILLVIVWMCFKRVCPWSKVKWGMDKVDDIFKIGL